VLVEIHFEKGKPIRFLAHLELMRAFERMVRRARLPMAYSEGYNPRPRTVYASALAVGMTSECERAALTLERHVPVGEVAERLAAAAPEGLCIAEVRAFPPQTKPSYSALDRVDYLVELPESAPPREVIEARIRALLDRNELVVIRKKEDREREVDLRPHIHEITVAEDGRLAMALSLSQEGQAKPLEVLQALSLHAGGDPVPWIHRVRHYRDKRGRRSTMRRR
jgi:radical SAM-linked protein